MWRVAVKRLRNVRSDTAAAAQDRLFGELHRVLRPGGTFVATDSLDTERIRKAHIDDTYVPLDPATLESRLRAAGFSDIRPAQIGEYRERGDQIRVTAIKR
jgi:predicted methyltransferase